MENQTKLLFSAFIVIIVGVVLLGTIGDSTELVKTSSYSVLNESVTISSGLGTLANDELISFDACRNSSMISIPTTGNYCNVTLTSGAVSVNPANFTDNLAFIGYTYEPDTYVHSSAARTILTLTILFFALFILAIGVGYAWKSLKEGGVIK